MTGPSRFRGLTAIALLRLSERELRSLHQEISEMSPGGFLELVRDIEDEVENSMNLTLHRAREGYAHSNRSHGLFREVDDLRKSLRVPVYKFAGLLAESVAEAEGIPVAEVPRFDSRRGLQSWLDKLAKTFSEQLVFHAAIKLEETVRNGSRSDWKLR